MYTIAHPTNENLRIRLEIDEAPPKPYNDGGFPIWRYVHASRSGSGAARQEEDITSYVTPSALDYGLGEAISRGFTRTMLTRYLRIFWGAAFFQTWTSSSGELYVTADPADWREKVGVTDEITRREDYTKHAWTEWQAWCEGDVWIATEQQRVQREVKTTTIYPDGTREDDFRSYEDEWIESEDHFPVGGFYGDLDQDLARVMAWQFAWPIDAGHHFDID